MKTNEIRIEIKAARKKVFEFTVEPKNKTKWMTTIDSEICNTEQISIGSLYTNNNGTYEVSDYEKDVFFELTHKETGYICSYSYHKVDENTTELVYFESMDDGSDLTEPMERKHFEKLKELLEK